MADFDGLGLLTKGNYLLQYSVDIVMFCSFMLTASLEVLLLLLSSISGV